MAKKLHQQGILQTQDVEKSAESIARDPTSKECMYSECNICKLYVPDVNNFNQEEITYTQWSTVTQPLPNDKERVMHLAKKVEKTETKQKMLELFQNSLTKFKRHLF